MMFAKSYVAAVAVLMLLAVSGPSFAAKRTSNTKGATHAAESHRSAYSGSAVRRSDPDPYAPGVNWPGRN